MVYIFADMKRKQKRINRIGISILLFAAAAMVWLAVRYISDPHHRYLIWGIDVSAHTGDIKWNKMSAHGIDFVFIKASEGETRKDKNFRANVKGANQTGIPAGAYHFFNFNRNGARQAANFLSAISKAKLTLPPVVDVEEWGNVVRRKRKYIISDLKTFIRIVEQSTRQKVLIYTNKDTYKLYVKDNFPEHNIWICSFDHNPEIDRPWTFWQYHHEGRLNGIQGKVDYNVFYGSKLEWKQYLKELKR